jgi:hypothetical protein
MYIIDMMETQPVQGGAPIQIPPAFYSTETGKPFTHCISCEKNILSPGTRYVIEKAITQYKDYTATDTIFEYAMCHECYQDILTSLSDTSKNNINAYFLENMHNVQNRMLEFMRDRSRVDQLIAACAIKGTPRAELNEYQIACHCNGQNLDTGYPPLLIGHEAIDEIMQLLSNKTLGEIDGFYNDMIKIPPEFKDILDGRPVFIL